MTITRTTNGAWSPPPSFREVPSERAGSRALFAVAALTLLGQLLHGHSQEERSQEQAVDQVNSPGGLCLVYI